MSFRRKLRRKRELQTLDKRISELLGMLEVSRSAWKRENIRVEGKGFDCAIARTRFKMTDKVKWGRHLKGRKPSRKEQFSVLFDLYKTRQENEGLLRELEERMKESKEKEEVNIHE